MSVANILSLNCWIFDCRSDSPIGTPYQSISEDDFTTESVALISSAPMPTTVRNLKFSSPWEVQAFVSPLYPCFETESRNDLLFLHPCHLFSVFSIPKNEINETWQFQCDQAHLWRFIFLLFSSFCSLVQLNKSPSISRIPFFWGVWG